MTEIKLDTNDDALRAVIGEAVVKAVSQQTRDDLIRKAVEHLLRPPKEYGYGYSSPLHQAYNQAVVDVAREEVRRIVKEDAGIRLKITQLIAAAVTKAIDGDTSELVESLARAVAAALTPKDR